MEGGGTRDGALLVTGSAAGANRTPKSYLPSPQSLAAAAV